MTTQVAFDEPQTVELMRLLDIASAEALTPEAILKKLRAFTDVIVGLRKNLAASHSGGAPNAVMKDVARRRKAAGLRN
jgi:hypothetical protein